MKDQIPSKFYESINSIGEEKLLSLAAELAGLWPGVKRPISFCSLITAGSYRLECNRDYNIYCSSCIANETMTLQEFQELIASKILYVDQL